MKQAQINFDKYQKYWSVRFFVDGECVVWKEYRESELDLALSEIKQFLL